MLLLSLLLILHSVALLLLISVKFRVNPWQCFCFTDSFATALGGSLTFYCPFCSTKFCNILDASFVSVH
jgi:hypothetical protein